MLGPMGLCATQAPVHCLDIASAFDQLSGEERLFAHLMREAGYHGVRINMRQVSAEAETIFDLIQSLGTLSGGDWGSLRLKADVNEEPFCFFLEYAATFLDNLGNFHGYGGQKFVPRITDDAFEKLASVDEKTRRLFDSIREAMYSVEPRVLGYPDLGGKSNFYLGPPDLTKAEIDAINAAILPYLSPRNTRLRRKTTAVGEAVVDGDQVPVYELLVASIDKTPATAITSPILVRDVGCETVIGRVEVIYGDFSDCLQRVYDGISRAIPLASTDARKAYLTKMLAFLQSGDIEKHKQAAIDWLSDAHPVVETWAGFLEPGRDPSGVRCEFRTLVAVKDKSWERAFTDLAAGAEQLIFQLPWNAGLRSPFELDKFVLPDLSALNLLCYCVSNQYTGLTAPGYPDIKAKYGYKNLTFTNRAKANSGVADQDYVVDEDLVSFQKHHGMCFFFQLALHEMLGHGCGKLFQETAPGEFNFDPADLPLNPLTDEPVNSWYSIGQSPETAFVGIATGYVECLAEGIGLYIMSAEGALKILAPDTEMDEDEVIYNAYLSIACMGLRALRSYDSRSQKWGQVHDHARYGLLRCFVASGVAKVEVRNEDCETDLKPRRSVKVTLNRDKIATVGRQALGDLIFKLQICRSIKDVARGTAIFLDLTTVDEQGLLWKEVVEENQKPRTLFVHANTILTESGDVVLKEYPPTKEGLIQAWLDRGPL